MLVTAEYQILILIFIFQKNRAMKKITIKLFTAMCMMLMINSIYAQVGIGTASPDAQLDIRSSSQATPANNDGILIPKVDVFPATNPTVAQQGMLVYLTTATTFGGNPKPIGFYYWNDSPADWIGISSAANGDHDWYEVGSTTAPNAITDDMFHTGNIAIGKNTANSALDVFTTGAPTSSIINTLNSTASTSSNRIGIENSVSGNSNDTMYGFTNAITNTGNGNHYGVSNQITSASSSSIFGFNNTISSNANTIGSNNNITNNNTSVATTVSGFENNLSGSSAGVIRGTNSTISVSGNGIHTGTFNSLTGAGTGIKYGIRNELSGSGSQFGIYNFLSGAGVGFQNGSYNLITNSNGSTHNGVVAALYGTGSGQKNGLYSFIDPTAGGTHLGVYSEVLKAGATNFAGYFLGNVGIGTTAANTYTFPPSRGTIGQVMQTNGTGVVSWASPNAISWDLGGNSAVAANFIGTTNPIAFRMFSNNIERMRINPTDGEVVVGAAASPYAGDAFSAVATPTLTFAVNGYTAQNGSGVWGEALAGSSTGFSAVQGYYGGSGVGSGVFGNYNGTNTSATRSGVTGYCSTPAATNGGAGITGYNAIAAGNQHLGVLGQYNGASFGIGVHGIGFGGGIVAGNFDIAVVGWRANNANYSGYFNGNHVIANGTKTASVGTSKGNQLLYVTELPEVWFEDVGGGQLVNGSIHVDLDPIFLETIFVDDKHPMRVFLQEEGESNGLIVIKDADNKGFTVKEKNGGTSNITFSFRIMAKRLHFQDHRFGNDPVWGAGDTRKYNQYATPPPVDYNENVRFQEAQKKNYKPTPMPEGFINYFQLQEEAKKMETEKTKKAEKLVEPANSLQPNDAKK